MSALRLLHLHSRFAGEGAGLRAARLMNAFGRGLHHTVVAAEPGALDAAALLAAATRVAFPSDFPPFAGKPFPRRLHRLAQAMAGFDLVLTYGRSGLDAAAAHAVFADALHLPPLVHHEDEAAPDRTTGRLGRWYRRLALWRAQAVIVPTPRLERLVRTAWAQPAARVRLIPDGIALAPYRARPRRDALPRLIKHRGELWLGTLAAPGAADLPALVRAFAALDEPWQLVIAGDLAAAEAVRAQTLRLDLAHRVHLAPFAGDPATVLGLFDLFVPPADEARAAAVVMRAMAAGLAVTPPLDDETALGQALVRLAGDPAARAALGAANRARAERDHDEAAMIAAHARVYAAALGRPAFP